MLSEDFERVEVAHILYNMCAYGIAIVGRLMHADTTQGLLV